MSTALLEITDEQRADDARRPQPVPWYRTPLSPEARRSLHARSDVRGALQTLGSLGIVACTGGLAFYSVTHWPWWSTVLLVFLHGTFFKFLTNGVHELGHGTVFKTKALNALFVRVCGFLTWMNFHMFGASHVRHHQFTLHPPDDLEVVLPHRYRIKHFFQAALISYGEVPNVFATHARVARGRFRGEWELKLFPPSNPDKRRIPINWSRTILAVHGMIFLGSVLAGIFVHPRWLMVTLLVDWAPFYGNWLHFLCNSTQHAGMQDNVSDFRLCCRTFLPNPFIRFLYWHMNYHIEHHMYAAVPCYRLGNLHRVICEDLPPCPRGIVATWKQIAAIQKAQDRDPTYQYAPPCPK